MPKIFFQIFFHFFQEAAMSSQNEIFSTPERSLSMASIEFIPNHADENHHNKNIELQEV